MNLVEIFKKYESYSNYKGTDKGTGHCYDDLYQQLLEPIRLKAKNVVEIGVFSGASCEVWLEYFSNATIYGIDISFQNLIYNNQSERMKYIKGNATTKEILKNLPSCIDFVLDDGSHLPDHQINSAKIFAPLISKDGIFICEDIHQNNINLIQKEFQIIADTHNMELTIFDLRDKKNKLDDDIVAVLKPK
jgi:hypothetical protein